MIIENMNEEVLYLHMCPGSCNFHERNSSLHAENVSWVVVWLCNVPALQLLPKVTSELICRLSYNSDFGQSGASGMLNLQAVLRR